MPLLDLMVFCQGWRAGGRLGTKRAPKASSNVGKIKKSPLQTSSSKPAHIFLINKQDTLALRFSPTPILHARLPISHTRSPKHFWHCAELLVASLELAAACLCPPHVTRETAWPYNYQIDSLHPMAGNSSCECPRKQPI